MGGLISLLDFIRPNTSLSHLARTRFDLKLILQACANGSSELMNNISSSIVNMIYNFQLLKYVGKSGVSAYNVLMYAQFIFIAIYIGYSIGASPIISFHYDMENDRELKHILKKSVLLIAVTSIILTVSASLLATLLPKIFRKNSLR